jgi:hypothetical protein
LSSLRYRQGASRSVDDTGEVGNLATVQYVAGGAFPVPRLRILARRIFADDRHLYSIEFSRLRTQTNFATKLGPEIQTIGQFRSARLACLSSKDARYGLMRIGSGCCEDEELPVGWSPRAG